MLICAGNSNVPLANELVTLLHATIVDRSISTFPNGEKRILLKTSVHGEELAIIQSFSQPVDEHIIELALLVDAAKRGGAKSITVVIPWMGYSLQNDVFRVGESLAAKVIADMLSALAIDKFLFVDLHNEEIVGFFTKHATNVSMAKAFAVEAKKLESTVVSPDDGGSKRAKHFATLLNLPYVELDKKRDHNDGSLSWGNSEQNLEGKTCILIDDVINTGSTAILAAKHLKKHGATKVMMFATHIVAGEKHVTALEKSELDQIIVSNTVDNTALKGAKNIRVVSAAPVIAAALK